MSKCSKGYGEFTCGLKDKINKKNKEIKGLKEEIATWIEKYEKAKLEAISCNAGKDKEIAELKARKGADR